MNICLYKFKLSISDYSDCTCLLVPFAYATCVCVLLHLLLWFAAPVHIPTFSIGIALDCQAIPENLYD